MKNLAKRNKINVFGLTSLYLFICLISLIALIVLDMFIFSIFSNEIITGLIINSFVLIFSIPLFVKNAKELYKILKLLSRKPEYYLEVLGDSIKVNALDGQYTINFKDIQRLNYSYDRALIRANFLLMYGNHKYKLNTNSEKSKSTYIMFDLSKEFVQLLKNRKKTKHGILLITTNDYFFALPEIENVEECFKELKKLINYNPTIKENEKNNYKDFLAVLYNNIMRSNKEENLEYNEKKFLSLVNMIEGSSYFYIELNIKYLEELGAINYVNLLKEAKDEIDNLRINNEIINGEDFAVQLLNKIRLLDEEEPFYKTYLVPFAKENLSKYIK